MGKNLVLDLLHELLGVLIDAHFDDLLGFLAVEELLDGSLLVLQLLVDREEALSH